MSSELQISIETSRESTRKIKAMLPGIVFAHDGSVYLRIASEEGRAIFLKDIEDSVKEVGVRAQVVNPCHVVLFDEPEYGRIVKKASLEIEI